LEKQNNLLYTEICTLKSHLETAKDREQQLHDLFAEKINNNKESNKESTINQFKVCFDTIRELTTERKELQSKVAQFESRNRLSGGANQLFTQLPEGVDSQVIEVCFLFKNIKNKAFSNYLIFLILGEVPICSVHSF
jgi:hypothetical protein